MKKYITIENAELFVSSTLQAVGTEPEIANIVAESLVEAEAKGVGSHGLMRLGSYIESVKNGSVFPKSIPTLLREENAATIVDGHFGFGAYTGIFAIKKAVKIAETFGIGSVAVTNIHHTGMLSFISEKAAQNGMIGIVCNNGHAAIAPPGGKKKVIGSNPFSISIPTEDSPFTIDMAISVVSIGTVRKFLMEGKELEKSWAIDADGNPTTDPAKALNGSLLPFSGYKGFGVGLIVDILAGLLTGSMAGPDVITWNNEGKHWTTGLFLVVIDPSRFIGREEFRKRVQEYLLTIRNSQGGITFNIPGEDRTSKFRESKLHGIILSDELYTSLNKVSSTLDVMLEEFLVKPEIVY